MKIFGIFDYAGVWAMTSQVIHQPMNVGVESAGMTTVNSWR